MRLPVAASWAARLERLGFAATAAAVATATLTAVRPESRFTASDGFLALAAALLVAARASGAAVMPRVPWWLIAAAAGLVLSGVLVELFPPPPSQIVLERAASYWEVAESFATSNRESLARFVAALLVMPAVVAATARSWRRVSLLVDLWLASVAVNCLAAVAYALGVRYGDPLLGRDYTIALPEEPDRLTGLTVHAVHLSLSCAMALPVAVARLDSPATSRRLIHAVLIPLLAIGVLLSGTRAGLVGGLVGVVAVLALQPRLRRWAVIGALGGAVLVPLAAASELDVLVAADRLLGGGSAVLSDERRELGYDQAWADISRRPHLGYGFEFVRSAHNIYLQLLQAGGPLALAAFALFAWGCLRIAVRLTLDPDLPDGVRALARALGVAFSVWLLTGLVQNSIFDRFLYLPAALLLALVTVAGRPEPLSGPAVGDVDGPQTAATPAAGRA